MEVVFISNYYNHHQLPFCHAMKEMTNNGFTFIATSKVSDWRKKFGYKEMTDDFVLDYDSNQGRCKRLIDDADCVIIGSAPYDLIKDRLRAEKLTFLYAERLHKEKYNYLKLVKHIPQFYLRYGRFRNFYCLCASAYTALDFSKTLTFVNKCYKWGYFPETKKYDSTNDLMKMKDNKKPSILFAGRLISWKHPEYPLKLANRLKEEGIEYHLDIIGIGDKADECNRYIHANGLENSVTMLGSMPPESVRQHMEKADVFLFTSDRREGWGAVLNESMNSGCAVVVNSAIGSAPFLIEDNVNGIMYKDGDFDDFYEKVRVLLSDKVICRKLGENAYKTIVEVWNAENAAKSLLLLSEAIMGKNTVKFDKGPCSKASVIKDGWYNKANKRL